MKKKTLLFLSLCMFIFVFAFPVFASDSVEADSLDASVPLKVVKSVSAEDYFKLKAEKTGMSLEEVRAQEIEKLKELHKKEGIGPFRAGDYNYAWVQGFVTFYTHDSRKGVLEVGTLVYRYFDRIIEVVDDEEYAMISTGASIFEITSEALFASKKSDAYVTMTGQVQVRTTSQYTVQGAISIGLPGAGFTAGAGGSGTTYYYKIVRINTTCM